MIRCVVLMALWMLAPAAPVRAAEQPVERRLPGPPIGNLSRSGEDFRVAPVQARDAQGQVLDLPATRIDLHSDLDGWEEPIDTLPPFPRAVPTAQQSQLALFHVSPVGWMLLPRDWKLVRATQSLDGSAEFSFTAAAGASQGWLTVLTIPACVGCMYQQADGLFEGAHAKLVKLMGASAPTPLLVPNPDKIGHADSCSTELSYRLPDSPTVRTLAFFADDAYDPSFQQLTLAVPRTQAKVGEAVVAAFRQALPACRGVSTQPAP